MNIKDINKNDKIKVKCIKEEPGKEINSIEFIVRCIAKDEEKIYVNKFKSQGKIIEITDSKVYINDEDYKATEIKAINLETSEEIPIEMIETSYKREQREVERYEVAEECVIFIGDKLIGAGKLRNISPKGFNFETEETLEFDDNTFIKIVFKSNYYCLTLCGKIIWENNIAGNNIYGCAIPIFNKQVQDYIYAMTDGILVS